MYEIMSGENAEIYEITKGPNGDDKCIIVRCLFSDQFSGDYGINEWKMTTDNADRLLDYLNRAANGAACDSSELEILLFNENENCDWAKNYVDKDEVVKAMSNDAEICSFAERAVVKADWFKDDLVEDMVEHLDYISRFEMNKLPDYKAKALYDNGFYNHNYTYRFEQAVKDKSIKETCDIYRAYENFEPMRGEERVFTIRITETMQRDVRIKATSEDDALEKIAELYYEQEIVLGKDDVLDEENNRFNCVANDDNLGDCEYSCDDDYEDDYEDEESRGR